MRCCCMGLKSRIRGLVAPAVRRAIASALTYPVIRRNVIRALAADPALENIPYLEGKHLDNARLFANRYDLISSLRCIEGGVIAEVGVAHGEFSEFLLNELKPRSFVAFDVFDMHEWGTFWGTTTSNLLNNMSHLEYYKRRFAHRSAQVVIEVGMSNSTLAKYPDKSFDLIYVD